MDYYESAEGMEISKKRALQELQNHNCTDIIDFFETCGNKEIYDAQDVLDFLGY